MSISMHTSFASAGWHAGFLNILPRIQTHARIKFRRLPPARREDAIAETIAAACQSYQILAAQGRLHHAYPSTLAKYAVNHVKDGRHVGGRQDAAKDAMSPLAQKRHGVQVVSYDSRHRPCWSAGWEQLAIADRKTSIPDLAAFRIDFANWLAALTRRDRRIIGALVAGERTGAVAGRFALSRGRISQLRRQYERQWQIFQGEAACDTAA